MSDYSRKLISIGVIASCLSLLACSSSQLDGEVQNTEDSVETMLTGPVSNYTFDDVSGNYVNLDFDMRYTFTGASLTLQSLNPNETFRVESGRLLFSDDLCLSIVDVDFSRASFETDYFGVTPTSVSPPAITVARVNQISLAAQESFRYFGYDETLAVSAATNDYNTANEWDDYYSGFTYFGNPSDVLGYNVPLGMCVQPSQSQQLIDIILVYIITTDNGSLRVRPFARWEEFY